MRKFLSNHFFSLVIGLVVVLLFITNYLPGTFLSGWDNLQTELSPWLAVKRAFWGVWQEYQSFGLTAGMGHPADLVRAVFLWLVSLVLPISVIRYFFHFLMVLIGGWGMFQLLKISGFDKDKKELAFFGSLFYILNFGTLQIVFLPFESFSVFLGFLPWEIWIFLKIINSQKKNKKDWFLLFLINFLATPQGLSQQLFLVYILTLGLIALSAFLKERGWPTAKKLIWPITVVLLINIFWLLPQIYFLKNNGSVIKEAKINQLATEDIFYTNLEKGNFKDFLLMQGFFYNRLGKNNQPLFAVWKAYRESWPIKILIYLISSISILGLFSKSRFRREFLLGYSLVVLALLNNVFPFNFINSLIRNNSLVNQIFRSPFTKFIIPYALFTSYFFTCGLNLIVNWSQKNKSIKSVLSSGLIIFIGASLFFVALPSFRGYFVSPEMKVKIPKDYFELIAFFKKEDKNKRIALLPEYTFWGWFYHNWGYDGSGFLWYGIEQPIVSRTFDVWSPKSESYFWEMKMALEAEDLTKLEKILQKYEIDFLVLDKSLLPVAATTEGMQTDRTESLLAKSQLVVLNRKWQNLSLYQVKQEEKANNFISLVSNLPNVGPEVKVMTEDTAYQKIGDYKTDKSSKFDFYYPFLDLTSQIKVMGEEWELSETKNDFLVEAKLEFDPSDYRLSEEKIGRNVLINDGEKLEEKMILTRFLIEDGLALAVFNKELLVNTLLRNVEVKDCEFPEKKAKSEMVKDSLKVTSKNGADGCFSYSFPRLSQNEGYLVKFTSQNLSGRKLFLYLFDTTKKQSYFEDRLLSGDQYYLIAPRFRYGIGYSLNFRNNSYKGIASINQLDGLEIYLLPHQEIKEFKLTKKGIQILSSVFSRDFEVKKESYYLYQAKINKSSFDGDLILWQAFDKGWIAWEGGMFLGKKLPHVLINNWANGWELPITDHRSPVTVYLFYWPQLLEYFGFLLLLIVPVVIWKTDFQTKLDN